MIHYLILFEGWVVSRRCGVLGCGGCWVGVLGINANVGVGVVVVGDKVSALDGGVQITIRYVDV
jgi:hypothetical protein